MEWVLLRAWPEGGGQGLEQRMRTVDALLDDGDYVYIDELREERRVEKRPEMAPEGYAYALHFVLSPADAEILRRKGWRPIDAPCPACPRV